jgi:hypothetical protein
MSAELYIARFSAWAPGITNSGEWKKWAAGTRIKCSEEASSREDETPEIAFTDSLFRRRLSQISKMTIQVVHDLLPLDEATKMFFISFRGELARQYKINKMVIEDKAIMPAAFSLSVFNAPIALVSMALGIKGGYTAIYPGGNSFADGLASAEAALLSGTRDELLLVYADEKVPQEYECLHCGHTEEAVPPPPLAFAILLTRKPYCDSVPLSSIKKEGEGGLRSFTPEKFLKQIILCKEMYASP